jgi:hypothetical protein
MARPNITNTGTARAAMVNKWESFIGRRLQLGIESGEGEFYLN